MALHLPPLATLRVFEAAARLNSFKLAASELGLTPSAVSHGVVTLEKWLEVDLFQRRGRGISLTPVGETLFPYISESLSMIAIGTQRASGRYGDRRISISVAPTFAARWLVPRLASFRKLHPEISVAIDTQHRKALFALDGVDLAIRMGKGPWPEMRSELILREKLVPVATPKYLRSLRRGGKKIDWARASLLRITSVEHDWDTWLAHVGLELPQTNAAFCFDTVQLAADAAAQGLGIAIGREPLISADLAAGRIVRAGTAIEIETGYWLTGPNGKETRREVTAFRRWILAQAEHAPQRK